MNCFFLSSAKREQKILKPLCGGRFFVSFYKAGYNIGGMDLSSEIHLFSYIFG